MDLDVPTWQTIYLAVILGTAVTALALAVYAWQYRDRPGVGLFIGMMVSIAGYVTTSGMMSASRSQAQAVSWVNPHYFTLTVMLAFFITFVIQYTGRERWLTKPRVAIIAAIPLITQVVIETNGLHRWFIRELEFTRDGLLMGLTHITYGGFFWFHSLYSYALVLIGIGMIVKMSFHAFHLYRAQSAVLLMGVLPPLLASINDSRLFFPGFEYPLVPIGFGLLGIALGWDMFRNRMLDIVPVARDTVIDNMSDSMLVLDGLANVVDINPAAQQLLKLDLSEIIGEPASQVLHPWCGLVEQYQGQTSSSSEVTVDISGEDRYFDLRISPLKGRNGHPNGRIITLRDITARKQAEEALHLTNHRLEESNAELETFAHTVAHDLKGPLSILLGYSEVLEEQCDEMPPEMIGDLAHTISNGGEKLAHIIDDLLLLASVREIEEITTTPLDMEAIVAQVLEGLAQMIGELEAEIVVPDVWPQAIGYGPWIESVWTNYITNALKYGGHPPRVELGASVISDGSGDMARFWVRDNGRGLSAEAQTRLFSPFTRLEQTYATSGHGLGLSIAKRIVEKLGGQVGVESDGVPGEGSTFTFTLPRGV